MWMGQLPVTATNWAEGFETIAEAIADANALDEIWVKAGTYAISSQIQVDEAIGIYGGFAGDEIQRSQRDWINNTTIIDGQGTTAILNIADEPIFDGLSLINGYSDKPRQQTAGAKVYAWKKHPNSAPQA